MKKEYQIALIFNNYVKDTTYANESYSMAFNKCKRYMDGDKDVVSCLIYSNQGTAIVIKRKHTKQ